MRLLNLLRLLLLWLSLLGLRCQLVLLRLRLLILLILLSLLILSSSLLLVTLPRLPSFLYLRMSPLLSFTALIALHILILHSIDSRDP